MKILLDEIDGIVYGDVILSNEELGRMQDGEMIDGVTMFQDKRCYWGVRLQGRWAHEEDWWQEEDYESF